MTESGPVPNVTSLVDSRLPWWLLLAACGGLAASLTWSLLERRRAYVDTAREELIEVHVGLPKPPPRGLSANLSYVCGVVTMRGKQEVTHEQAPDKMVELLQRNYRFAHSELAPLRTALASGQRPFAAVVCCADSRVSPELIFESSLGELFVVRTAGNLVDEIALGSLEFAVEQLGVQLLLVLGHGNCGAVSAAVAAAQADGSHQLHDDNHPAHHVAHLVAKILPAVRSAMEVVSKEAGEVDKERLIDVAISENVLATQHEILSRSSILRAFAADKKLAVRAGVYCLSTGVVSLINP